jgi:DNA-binding CsgD family transcriptional regulator
MDDVAETNPFASLTAEQIEALRLVRDGFTSKQIAQRLNISRWAVDQRVDRARARLGAADRGEAARMLSLWEREEALSQLHRSADAAFLARPAPGFRPTTYETPSEGFVREPQPLFEPIGYGNVGASYAGPSTAADENRVREMPARFGESGGISLLRPYGVGEQREGRKALNTLVLIMLAAMAMAIVLIALPSLVRNAQDVANSVRAYTPVPRK